MSRKRTRGEDLTSFSDDLGHTDKYSKRYSYDCAIHLDEMPATNNNDATDNNEAADSSNENLSETDSENDEPSVGNKNYRKETYI